MVWAGDLKVEWSRVATIRVSSYVALCSVEEGVSSRKLARMGSPLSPSDMQKKHQMQGDTSGRTASSVLLQFLLAEAIGGK
jgi:hypothetical protein